MRELKFQTKLVKSTRAQGGYARKLSHRFVIGIPDLIVHIPNYAPFLLEVKYFPEVSPNSNKLIPTTPKQQLELTEFNSVNIDAGSTAGVAIGFCINKRKGLKVYTPEDTHFTLKEGLDDPDALTPKGGLFNMTDVAIMLKVPTLQENNG